MDEDSGAVGQAAASRGGVGKLDFSVHRNGVQPGAGAESDSGYRGRCIRPDDEVPPDSGSVDSWQL